MGKSSMSLNCYACGGLGGHPHPSVDEKCINCGGMGFSFDPESDLWTKLEKANRKVLHMSDIIKAAEKAYDEANP